MSEEIFVGNFPSSMAKKYTVSVYTHTETVKKRRVKYYDCFVVTNDFKHDAPKVGDEPDRNFIKRAEKAYKRKK